MLAVSVVHAQYTYYNNPTQKYYQDKERGWFWKEEPEIIEEVEPEKPEPPKPVVIAPPPSEPAPPPGPEKFSAEWLKVNLPIALNSAIDNPTQDNVAYYLYLQRLTMDKASRYAEMVKLVTAQDPVLAEMDRRPNASFAAKTSDRQAQDNTAKVMQEVSKQAVLWFFYASDCPYCHKSIPMLNILQNAYGFRVRAISLDGKPLLGSGFERNYIVNKGQAQSLGVTTTPTLVLVRPGEKPDIIKVSSGAIGASEFAKRTAMLATREGWISNDAYESTLPVKPRYIDHVLADVVKEEDLKNPEIAVRKIRDYMQSELTR